MVGTVFSKFTYSEDATKATEKLDIMVLLYVNLFEPPHGALWTNKCNSIIYAKDKFVLRNIIAIY